jgi:FkbM family methyltransferase
MNTQWYAVDGDNTYAINWPLTPKSIVFEVGAYEGRWAKQIINKYKCTVHAFEPQYWAAAKLLMLQAMGYPQLVIHPYALGNRDVAQLPMGEFETDACSFLLPNQRKQGYGEMRDACSVIAELIGDKQIDLMMVNIEGYEYELINYMISCLCSMA